jgi:hypothetical protein
MYFIVRTVEVFLVPRMASIQRENNIAPVSVAFVAHKSITPPLSPMNEEHWKRLTELPCRPTVRWHIIVQRAPAPALTIGQLGTSRPQQFFQVTVVQIEKGKRIKKARLVSKVRTVHLCVT